MAPRGPYKSGSNAKPRTVAARKRVARKQAEAAGLPSPDLTQEAAQADVERRQAAAEQANQLRIVERLLKIKKAKDSLIDFAELMMPHPEDPDDATRSRYDPQYFHRALAAALEEVEAGRILRLIVTFPPRHGKSEISSRKLPAWFIGRDPYRHLIFATYNQPFAEDFGRDVRACMQSPMYGQVFPAVHLRKGEAAADRLKSEEGGLMAFVGRCGSITGRGADLLIIDDPLKDRAEANSAATRQELWDWFNDTASTRLMSDTGAIIIIQTRWHEDDLVGRLTDPGNPCYNEEEAAKWKVINIPAIAEEDDVLGRLPGAALWPEKFGVEYLESFRRRNPKGFSALYQQRPTPEDGDFFKADYIKTYRAHQLPPKLRIYAASDHAVGTKQENDKNCLLVVGVDDKDRIWLLDAWWKRAKTDETVDAMITLMKRWKPLTWWAEGGHISKSIGPFLYKRMQEEKVYVAITEQTPSADKQTRAQAIQGRMSMGMVLFDQDAWWFQDAKGELLKFPQARHDDFVDALAHIGLGLERIVKASGSAANMNAPPAVGTLAWVRWAADQERKRKSAKAALGGM